MDCPKCKKSSFDYEGASKVIDSRSDGRGGVRRRRNCPACGWRFTTYEVHSHNMIDEQKIQKDKEVLVDSLVSASISIEHLLELTKKQILCKPS